MFMSIFFASSAHLREWQKSVLTGNKLP